MKDKGPFFSENTGLEHAVPWHNRYGMRHIATNDIVQYWHSTTYMLQSLKIAIGTITQLDDYDQQFVRQLQLHYEIDVPAKIDEFEILFLTYDDKEYTKPMPAKEFLFLADL
jgi:hypothetical protein